MKTLLSLLGPSEPKKISKCQMWQILRKLLPQKYVVKIDQSFNLINLSFNSKLKGHLPKQEDNTINFYSFIPIPSEKNEAFFSYV